MTISKYITEFLKGYESIKIDTNHVAEGSDKYGLFKSPSRDKTDFIDGSYEVTEYYQFFARFSSVADAERKESDEWLEEFTYWLDDYKVLDIYPDIDGDRRVVEISATGCPTALTDADDKILYQITLSIKYEREVI